MKKFFTLVSGIVLIFIGLNACKKTNNTSTVNDATLLEDFFARNLVPTQNFTVNAGTGGTLTTAAGTRITFPPNALLTASGAAVTGTVNVRFKEINRKVDFVLSNKGTVANGEPLESGGTWKLEIDQAGQALRINPAAGVQLNIPRDTAVQAVMQLFNAAPKGNNDAGAINWGQPRRDVTPLSAPFANYFCSLDSVGWGNADKFLTNPQYAQNIQVIAANGADLTNFSAMFIYKGRKTVWPLQKSGTIFNDSHIAIGQQGHFVVFGFVNGVFTTGILQDQTITVNPATGTANNQTFTVTLTTNTETGFKAQLSSIL